jgi:hypothetical protein
MCAEISPARREERHQHAAASSENPGGNTSAAGKAWYVSELARRMGVPSSSLKREPRDLAEAGVLKTHRQGRMSYYQANVDSPLFPDLRGLLLKFGTLYRANVLGAWIGSIGAPRDDLRVPEVGHVETSPTEMTDESGGPHG